MFVAYHTLFLTASFAGCVLHGRLYEEILANPKHVGAVVWLRNSYASYQLGRTKRRSAQISLNESIKIARRHGSGGIAEEGEDGSSTDGSLGASRVSSAGAKRGAGGADGDGDGMGLSMEQMWVARYSLALMLQQDGATQQAMGHFEQLLSEAFQTMPGSQYRIASLTGMASCLSQLGRQVEAFDACEAAVKLGAGGEVLFVKALLAAQVGKMDESISTLTQLLQTIPDHLRGLLALSSMLAYNGALPKALGQAAAAREMARDEMGRTVATQQVGLLRMRMGMDEGSMTDVGLARSALEQVTSTYGPQPPAIATDGFVALALAMCALNGNGEHALADALSELKKGQLADPLSALPLYYRGRLLRRKPQIGEDPESAADENVSPLSDAAPVTDEAASCFLAAAVALGRKLPEAGDECSDLALKAMLFPVPTGPGGSRPGSSRTGAGRRGSVQAGRPGSARPGSAKSTNSSEDENAGPAAPPPTLTAVLMYVTKREEALYLVDCLHNIAVHAHRNGLFSKAASHYDFAARLADRVATASKGQGGLMLARAEAAAGWATLNRGRLFWSSGAGDPTAAVADFDAAAKAFERAMAQINTPASILAAAQKDSNEQQLSAGASELPSMVANIRKGTVTAFFNLGAAQEAAVVQQTMDAGRAAAKEAREAGRPAPRASVLRRGSTTGLAVTTATKDAQQCFTSALSYDQMHGPAHVALASLLLRKHKPRQALEHLNHHALENLPLAAINRGVVMQDLDGSREGLEAARRETERALEQLSAGSVVASFNHAQIDMLMGEWCNPLAKLQHLSSLRLKRIDSPAAAVDGTGEAERAWINAQLEPLLQACRKWQAVLQIAVNDFRTCASLMQPQLSFAKPSTDEIFAPPDSASSGEEEESTGAMMEHASGKPPASGPPLTTAQLTLLESLIEKALKEEATASAQPRTTQQSSTPTPSQPESPLPSPNRLRRSKEGDSDSPAAARAPSMAKKGKKEAAEGISAPATQLPSNVLASSLKRVLVLQTEFKFQPAERLLDSALRPLLPPASRALGAVGALLYTWRARSRLIVGKKVEAEEDLRVALAHVGAENLDGPPSSIAEALAEADEKAMAQSTAAAVSELTKLRRAAAAAMEVVEAAEAKLADAVEAADAVRGTSAQDVANALVATVEAEVAEAETGLDAFRGNEEANAQVIVAAAAAVVVPRAAWWACGLLLEEGRALEARNELSEARRHYSAATAWQKHHVVANANAARLLETIDNDLVGAATCYIQIIESTAEARRHAADASKELLEEDDDEDEVNEMRHAAKCAFRIRDELIEQRQILQTGFAQRPADAGPPSELPVIKQQGGIAIAMDEERHRQKMATERALGMESSAPAANEVRRQRVAEATKIGGTLLAALAYNPQRLFDTVDGDLTFLLWGVEKSTVRLQAAMSRSAKVTDKKKDDEEEDDAERPGTVPAGSSRIGSAPPVVARPEKKPQELVDRLMHWGDDGSVPDVEINVPLTERFISDVKNRRTDET